MFRLRSSATECGQVFGMASDAAHLQEAVLETVAFQALLELPLKIVSNAVPLAARWDRKTG